MKPVKEILVVAIFAMGILHIAYVVLWPILPQAKFRALPWLLVAVVGLAATGRMVWRRVGRTHQDSARHGKIRRQDVPWRLPLPESLRKAIKEILTQTILCLGAVFTIMAIVVPFLPTEPFLVHRWGALALLALIAMCWTGEQWIKKRRQSGGDGTGHPPALRTAFR